MNNLRKGIIKISVIAIIIFASLGLGAMTVHAEESERVFGQNRYETAQEIAEKLYAKSGAFNNVIVAYGDNFPDALSGGYLAKVKNAPILLVNDFREESTLEYINRRAKKSGTIYLLGGEGVISQRFEEMLIAEGFKVKRLGGTSRYETNLEILREAKVNGKDLLVASATSYADSISASSTGRPILLVGNSLNSEQKSFLKNNKMGFTQSDGRYIREL